MHKKIPAHIINDALAAHEAGRSVLDIVREHPEYEAELARIFSVIASFEKVRDAATPSREVFTQLMERFEAGDAPVTDSPDTGYMYEGRSRAPRIIDMLMKGKFVIPAGVALVAIAIIASVGLSQRGPMTVTFNDGRTTAEMESIDQAETAGTMAFSADTTGTAAADANAFDETAVAEEAETIGFDSSFDQFFAEEEAFEEYDRALSEF